MLGTHEEFGVQDTQANQIDHLQELSGSVDCKQAILTCRGGGKAGVWPRIQSGQVNRDPETPPRAALGFGWEFCLALRSAYQPRSDNGIWEVRCPWIETSGHGQLLV